MISCDHLYVFANASTNLYVCVESGFFFLQMLITRALMVLLDELSFMGSRARIDKCDMLNLVTAGTCEMLRSVF